MSPRLRVRPVLALAASALTVFALTGSASATSTGSPLKLTASHTAIDRTVPISAATVRRLVDHGARVTVHFTVVRGEQGGDVRLFVYQRALNRGGATASHTPASFRTSISSVARLPGVGTGTRTVSLHVLSQYRTALLHAGPIDLGIEAYGYGS